MSNPSPCGEPGDAVATLALMSKRLRLLLTALAMAALLWLLFAAAERALALTQRFLALPTVLQWTLGTLLALFAAAGLGETHLRNNSRATD